MRSTLEIVIPAQAGTQPPNDPSAAPCRHSRESGNPANKPSTERIETEIFRQVPPLGFSASIRSYFHAPGCFAGSAMPWRSNGYQNSASAVDEEEIDA
jgi:hypothetical protein